MITMIITTQKTTSLSTERSPSAAGGCLWLACEVWLCCAVKILAASGGFLPPHSCFCLNVQFLSILPLRVWCCEMLCCDDTSCFRGFPALTFWLLLVCAVSEHSALACACTCCAVKRYQLL